MMKITCMICGGIILKSCICWILKDLPNTKTLLSLACPALEFFQDLVFFCKARSYKKNFPKFAGSCKIYLTKTFQYFGWYHMQKPAWSWEILVLWPCKIFQDLSISWVIWHAKTCLILRDLSFMALQDLPRSFNI